MVDRSTLIESGDADDAENIDALLGHPALTDYVHPDEQFTISNTDPTAGTFDISSGKAYVGVTSLQTSTNEERRRLMVACEHPGSTSLSVANVDATNYVYLDAQIGVGDSPTFVVKDTKTPPSDESLLIAVLHVSDDDGDGDADVLEVTDYPNRGPDAVFDSIEGPSDEISLSSSSLVDAGHDEVDVPQTRNLTVDDFEAGVLSDAYEGDRGSFSVQSSVVASGSYALEAQSDATGLDAPSGLGAYPQRGDTFSFKFYFTDTDDQARIRFGAQETGEFGSAYIIRLRTNIDKINLIERPSVTAIIDEPADLSSHLNEWLEMTVKWGTDDSFSLTLVDSNDNELASVSGSVSNDFYTSGFVSIYPRNTSNTSIAQYYDDWTVTRRPPEYYSETQNGNVVIGNRATGTGGANFGPHEAVSDGTTVHGHLRSADSLAGGDNIEIVEWDAGIGRRSLKAQADGNGGVYGLRSPLARRVTEQLTWEYESLADVPNWETASSDTSFTHSLTGRPRTAEVSSGGGSSSFIQGGYLSNLLTTVDSLGQFRLTFRGVMFTNNDHGAYVGFSDVSDGSLLVVANGNAVVWDLRATTRLVTVSGGTSTNQGSFSYDQTAKHDVSLEYDGSNVVVLIDGEFAVKTTYSVSSDFKPIIQLVDRGGNTSSSDTLSVDDVTVEEL